MKIRIRTTSEGFYAVEYKKTFFSGWKTEYVCTNKEDACQRLKECKKRLLEIMEVASLGVIYEENLNENV